MLFVCPKCSEKLNIEDTRAVCKNGHSFDRAREGYYNLLLGGGGTHGDNREMVKARRAFLSGGYYEPLARTVADLLKKHALSSRSILDIGCGEGYYTDIISAMLSKTNSKARISAFDISKDAVKECAKKNKELSLAVASAYHMPLEDGAVDAAVNIFSPLALEETLRVLKKGGIFIMAIPGEDHLFELKEKIYDTPYKNTVADTALVGFALLSDTPLKYKMKLESAEAVNSLFMMTPYAYRTRPENKARIDSLDFLECTAHFRIFVYEKTD